MWKSGLHSGSEVGQGGERSVVWPWRFGLDASQVAPKLGMGFDSWNPDDGAGSRSNPDCTGHLYLFQGYGWGSRCYRDVTWCLATEPESLSYSGAAVPAPHIGCPDNQKLSRKYHNSLYITYVEDTYSKHSELVAATSNNSTDLSGGLATPQHNTSTGFQGKN